VKTGVISTSIVIILGFAMITPFFINFTNKTPKSVLLFFYVNDDSNITDWCHDLSRLLEEKEIKATIFFSGKIAEQYPECVSLFSEGNDIGSQTYSYTNLSLIDDYSIQLEEIQKGKQLVDIAGNLSSKLFRVPIGYTDDNIYSLLSRSDIIADFSYKTYYNKYHMGQFLLFNITYIDGLKISPRSLKNLEKTSIIFFNNSTPVKIIRKTLSHLTSSNTSLINASDLTGLQLTIRNGEDH
jgi:peptidoglycan/xylan/chitin deacetylase (PgdA/CDA1 family)